MVTKYKEAARIANSALEAVIAACTAGANLVRSLPRCRTPIRQRLTMARRFQWPTLPGSLRRRN